MPVFVGSESNYKNGYMETFDYFITELSIVITIPPSFYTIMLHLPSAAIFFTTLHLLNIVSAKLVGISMQSDTTFYRYHHYLIYESHPS